MRTLHLVSHTHWDREWYLTFQQFRLKLVHLIDGLLEILESDHQYRFFMLDGQTIVLDDYLAIRPEREAALRKFIRNGRIIIGPWHILPDEFLVSPEATIRNLLQGERTCRKFGSKMRIGYIPDPFGHIGQMPQILRGFGIQDAAFRRGLSDEPCELWWEAPDGSRVLAAYLRDGYDNAASLPTSDGERFVSEVCRLRDSLAAHAASPHILLMQGTDHMEPLPDTPQAITYAQDRIDGDRLIHSSLPEYLKGIRGSMDITRVPVIRGELRSPKRHHLLPAVLSTRMWIKQRNRSCESLLEKWAEPFGVFAERAASVHLPSGLVGKPEILRTAWRILMENHPHDSICGCSIDQVHEEMRARFDQVEQIGEELLSQSLESLASSIDTRAAMLHPQGEEENRSAAIVVFNPSSAPRTDIAFTSLNLPNASNLELLDENGNSLPYQILGLGSRELINVVLTPKELQSMYVSIHEGHVAGMAIQDIHMHREGGQVDLEVIMTEQGEPNALAWKRAVAKIEEYIADPAITSFHARARSPEATRILFSAPDVPALGYRTFWVHEKSGEYRPIQLGALGRILIPLGTRLARFRLIQRLLSYLVRPARGRQLHRIENEFFIVNALKDGTLAVQDKRMGMTYRGLNRFMDGGDCGDDYNYAPPLSDLVTPARLKGVTAGRGSVEQVLELALEITCPVSLTADRKARARQLVHIPIKTRIQLHSGVPRIDIHTEVENLARDHRLRVHFPAPYPVQAGDHDGHFEVIRRPVGVPESDETWVEQPRPEVPQRAFTDISDGNLGLMVANRGLPEVEVLEQPEGNAEIALTLLRCVGWLSRDDFPGRKGHAGPMQETPGAQLPGKWSFDYSIIPHRVDWAYAFHQAFAFEVPLRAVSTHIHSGSLTPSDTFLKVDPETFVVSAVKEADEGNGWLVRGYNISGEKIEVSLRPRIRSRKVERVNLAEEKEEGITPATDGMLRIPAREHEVVSVLFHD